MKIRQFFSILLFCTGSLFAQTMSTEHKLLLHPQGFILPAAFSTPGSIETENPASMADFSRPAASISYRFEGNIQDVYYKGTTVKHKITGLPQSAGIVYPYKDFRFAACMNQRYRSYFESPVTVTTVDNPDGNGKSETFFMDARMSDYSVLASYSLNDMPLGNKLSLGAKLSLSHLYNTESLFSTKMEASDNVLSFALGAEYTLALQSEKSVKIGISYERAPEFNADIEFTTQSSLVESSIDPANSGRPHLSVKMNNIKLSCKVPDILKLNFSFDLIPHLRLIETFSSVYWNQNSDGYKNQFEFSTGAVYTPNEIFSYSLSLFSTGRNLKNTNSILSQQGNDAVFITGGVSANFGPYNLALNLTDSHLFSDDARKTTAARISLGYQIL